MKKDDSWHHFGFCYLMDDTLNASKVRTLSFCAQSFCRLLWHSRGKSGVIGHGPQRDWQSQETAIPNGNQSCGEPQGLAQTGGSKGGAKAGKAFVEVIP